ncbi:MAG: hypothetical protein IPJ61_06600 [Tessaracoccus sp.]|uniref:hypothetical protein n=1 Tax=Tessaracoccus sp. TaxID=1971211 RepID=UPI001EBD652E|nr:hypothetical protein [Tessaracoccus sp.]MBK7820740.1 hypothetical protein [Tessaracoccus sp.]
MLPVLVAAASGALIGFIGAGPVRGFVDLRDVVQSARLAVPYAALPIGWLMVWAMSVHRPDSVLIGPAPGRGRGGIVARQVAVLTVALLVGFALGLAPMAAYAAATQHWTLADPVSLLTVAAGLASLVPIAAGAALLVGPRLGLLVAPAVVAAVTALPTYPLEMTLLADSSASVEVVSYVWGRSHPLRGEMLVWQVEAFRVAYFLLVGAAALRAASALAEWRAARDVRALGGLAALAVPAAVAAVVAVVHLPLTAPDPADVVRCADDRGLTLCLYAIDEPNRAEAVRTLEPFALMFPSRDFVFTQDRSAPGIVIGRIGADAAERLTVEVRGIGGSLVEGDDVRACNEAPYEANQVSSAALRQVFVRGGNQSDDPAARAIWHGVLEDDYASEATAALDRLSYDEFLAWLEAHADDVAACRAMPEDLP